MNGEVRKGVDVDMVGGCFALLGKLHLLLDTCCVVTMSCHLTTVYLHAVINCLLGNKCSAVTSLTKSPPLVKCCVAEIEYCPFTVHNTFWRNGAYNRYLASGLTNFL